MIFADASGIMNFNNMYISTGIPTISTTITTDVGRVSSAGTRRNRTPFTIIYDT